MLATLTIRFCDIRGIRRARDMYWEMQQITSGEGGAVIPLFADHLIGHSDKLAHGNLAGNWEMDGYRMIERWWFA